MTGEVAVADGGGGAGTAPPPPFAFTTQAQPARVATLAGDTLDAAAAIDSLRLERVAGYDGAVGDPAGTRKGGR